ncbi:MAG: hypothetical protein OXP37_01350 [Chloroflexota bacterium]|nr:hypothetical protein [Chloroflexota bacterium]
MQNLAQSFPVLLLRMAFMSPGAWRLLLADPKFLRIGLTLAAGAGLSGTLGLSIGRPLDWSELAINAVVAVLGTTAGCAFTGGCAHLLVNRIGSGRATLAATVGAVGCAHVIGFLQLLMILPAWTFGVWAIAMVWTVLAAGAGVAMASRASLAVCLPALVVPWAVWAVLQLSIWIVLGGTAFAQIGG